MLFEDNEIDINMAFFMPDVNFRNNSNIEDAMDGFMKGNMFKDEYLPYKGLTYFKLQPKNEKEKALYKIMALSFAINDLNLYLDLHPEKKDIFMLFKKYVEEKERLCKEYEKVYGPLEVTGTTGDKFDWIDSPWPWDNKGGTLYV